MSRTTRAPTAPPRRRPTMVKLYALLAAPAAALVAKTNPLPRAAPLHEHERLASQCAWIHKR